MYELSLDLQEFNQITMKKGLFFLLLLIMGCQSYPELTWKEISYKKKSTLVSEGGYTTDVHFLIPQCQQDEWVCKKINDFFIESTADILGFDNPKNNAYERLAEQFIHSYDEIHKVLPTHVVPWEAKIEGHVEDLDTLVNAYVSYYVFSGGTSVEEGVRSGFFSKQSQQQI